MFKKLMPVASIHLQQALYSLIIRDFIYLFYQKQRNVRNV